MRIYGLLGYPLSHSFSPSYFKAKFEQEGITDCVYNSYEETDIEAFVNQVRKQNDFIGFNITIPYKEQIIPHLDSLSDEAQQIGAVNTVKKVNGELVGYNTDVFGFKKSLQSLLTKNQDHALILGTGGASKAIGYALSELNIIYQKVSRLPKPNAITYSDLNQSILEINQILINTTPLGTYPNVDSKPDIPYSYITNQHLCYDLVYNPAKTAFLSNCEQHGARIKNGEEMLHLQANKSWNIWNQK